MVATRTDLIDFTVMYATHRAFRRDLARLLNAATSGNATAPKVLAGWENFQHQLHVHHTVEDEALWPPLRDAVRDRPEALAVTDEMEAEHAQLDSLLAQVEQGLRQNSPTLTDLVRRLTKALAQHLTHEEEGGLPLIQTELTKADWRGFTDAMRRRQGIKGASVYVPWVLDGTAPEQQREFLAAMPPPVRALNGLVWRRSYERRGLWAY